MPTPTDATRVSGTHEGSDEGVITIPQNAVPEVLRNANHPNAVREQTFIINGKEVSLTPEQQVEYIQKAAAADEKFRQAAETRKEAERALALQSDLEAIIRDGDVDAFRRMGAEMGIPGDRVEQEVRALFGDDGDEDEGQVPPQEASRTVGVGNRKVDLDSLSPDIQRLLLRAEKQRIDEIVTQALDSNESVAYNMKQYDAEGQKVIRKLVEDKIRGRLNATGGDFGDGSLILREVLPEVDTLLKALGSPRRQVQPLGMGPSPSGAGDVYPKKRPDHVPSTSGGFEQHILDDMLYNLSQVERAQRG